MKDRIFIDTNILIYGIIEKDKEKHDKVKELFQTLKNKEIYISIQIINELYSALSKNKIVHEEIENHIDEMNEQFNIEVINFDTIKKALNIKKKYGYSYWDSCFLQEQFTRYCKINYPLLQRNLPTLMGKFRFSLLSVSSCSFAHQI